MRRTLPLALALALAASSACATAESGDEGPIKVGYISPITGTYSALGTDNQKAVELAVDQINADGGLLGREVELLTRNDQSSPDQSVLAFNDLQGSDPVAVIGSAVSDSALATIPAVERHGIPYLSPTPADEQLDPLRENVFVVPATTSLYAQRIMEYLQAEGMTRVAVAYSSTAYALAGFEAMEEEAADYGLELVFTNEYQQDTSDFQHVFSGMQGDDPDVLVFWGSGPPGVTFAQQYATAEVDTPLVMTGAQASHLWLEPAGGAAEGVTVLSAIGVVGDHLPEGEQKDVITEMSEAFEAEYGYAPPQFAQDGYSAVMLLAAAIEEAGSADREAVRDALEDLTLTTPNGTFSYSATDHSGLTTDAISVNTVQDGAFVPVPWSQEQLDSVFGG